MRVGIGYDIHRLVEGRRLILGGVEIPYITGLLGHSDADVLCHAIADALLGAAELGDIGTNFPDTDQKYKGVSSLVLLENVVKQLSMIGYVINNIDTNIIAQAPKIAPYAEQMQKNIALALGIRQGQISIKATTTEGLGSIGEGLGIAAQAICTIERP